MSEIQIDKLIRSYRKTIGLQITKDASLIVRAPYFASDGYIQKLIQSKASWIKTKQEYFRKRQEKVTFKRFIPGEEFLFLGQSYSLIAKDDLPKAVVFDNALMISNQVLANAREHLENWYRVQALEYISERVKLYAQATGLCYQSIRVNEAKTRWGSCGFGNSLNFTWRLIMAPARVIDYVVVHELMHIKQKNHSRKFWAEVKKIIPDYKQDEKWLKENSLLLTFSVDG